MTALQCPSLLIRQWARRTGLIFSADMRFSRSLLMVATVASIRFDTRLPIVPIELTLHAASYDWEFVPVTAQRSPILECAMHALPFWRAYSGYRQRTNRK